MLFTGTIGPLGRSPQGASDTINFVMNLRISNFETGLGESA